VAEPKSNTGPAGAGSIETGSNLNLRHAVHAARGFREHKMERNSWT
jgi:hypothetical protein